MSEVAGVPPVESEVDGRAGDCAAEQKPLERVEPEPATPEHRYRADDSELGIEHEGRQGRGDAQRLGRSRTDVLRIGPVASDVGHRVDLESVALEAEDHRRGEQLTRSDNRADTDDPPGNPPSADQNRQSGQRECRESDRQRGGLGGTGGEGEQANEHIQATADCRGAAGTPAAEAFPDGSDQCEEQRLAVGHRYAGPHHQRRLRRTKRRADGVGRIELADGEDQQRGHRPDPGPAGEAPADDGDDQHRERAQGRDHQAHLDNGQVDVADQTAHCLMDEGEPVVVQRLAGHLGKGQREVMLRIACQ